MLFSVGKFVFFQTQVKSNVLFTSCKNLERYSVRRNLFSRHRFEDVKSVSKYGTSADQNSHYNTLGIERSATKNEIKDAYIRLSKVYHPDKLVEAYGGNEVNKFLKVNNICVFCFGLCLYDLRHVFSILISSPLQQIGSSFNV